LIALLGLIVAGVVVWQVLTRGAESLVVYCAHDSVYSQPVIEEFERRTGIRVRFVPDTEASKSLGFVQKLLAEKDAPRCDVFWNNEQLGMMDLADAGVLEAYQGENAKRIPASYKDAAGLWTGFAARMRVWIVHLDKLNATPAAIDERVQGELSRCGIAKPLYGTTRTHYTVLWHSWGGDKLKAWHKDTRQRGIVELPGNGPVKNQVASGTLDFGLTVALVKGSRRSEDAKKLIEFLLSEDVELMLANSKARQLPLGKVDETKLSADVKALMPWVAKGYPLSTLGEARDACLKWLREEYVK
jgi:iron(III) transport system substrate-binding protein